ncbi:MAG: HutD family protein [Lutibacter sp.]|jgi:environmental stress-induced protein Ves
MKFNIYSFKDFKTTKWAGGNTTELYIYPPTANYATGNFNFRISTASVEVEEADFTVLPKVARQLMVLKGSITLSHKDHHQVQLNKNEIAFFDGSWETSSVGTCVDFNLMTKGNTKGRISSILKPDNKSVNFQLDSNCEFIFFYAYEGKLQFHFNSEKQDLNRGELMVIQHPFNEVIKLEGQEKCAIVVVNIYK